MRLKRLLKIARCGLPSLSYAERAPILEHGAVAHAAGAVDLLADDATLNASSAWPFIDMRSDKNE